MPVQTLRSVDEFYRNAFLLSSDLERFIENNMLPGSLIRKCGPEGGYWVNLNESEAFRLFVFEANDRIRFFYMNVKTHDNYLRGNNSPGFRGICNTLGRDQVFPLLLGVGYFELDGAVNFLNNYDMMRQWCRYSMMIGINDSHIANLNGVTNLYAYGQQVTVGNNFQVDGLQGSAWWGVRSTVRIYDLLSIADSAEAHNKINELLNM